MKTALFILIACAMALAACQTTNIPDTAKFTYTSYGGFVRPDYNRQTLEISPGKLVYTIGSIDGAITQKAEKRIDEKTYQDTLKAFRDNDFMSFPDKFDRVEMVADMPTREVWMTAGSTTKKVIFIPGSQPTEKANTILSEMQALIDVALSLDKDGAKTFAEAWIRQAPTYAFDGTDLAFKDIKTVEMHPTKHTVTYAFKTLHGGYGNRTGYMLTQVVTEHRIILTIEGRTVTSALIDEKWNELSQQPLGGYSDDTADPDRQVTIKFQPAQCEKTPWQQWYEQGGITFVKAPTDEEVLIPYYGQNYNVDVTGYKKVESGNIVCQACSVCPTDYSITVTVKASDANLMTKLGWERM